MSIARLTDLAETSLGEKDGVFIDDTNETTGNFSIIYPLEYTEIDEIIGNIDGLSSCNLLAGIPLYGRFTSITLTSGKVIAYY